MSRVRGGLQREGKMGIPTPGRSAIGDRGTPEGVGRSGWPPGAGLALTVVLRVKVTVRFRGFSTTVRPHARKAKRVRPRSRVKPPLFSSCSVLKILEPKNVSRFW